QIVRRGQGKQLAACAERPVLALYPCLLDRQDHHQRLLDAAGGATGELGSIHGTQVRVARTCVWMSLLAQSGLLPVEGDPRLQQKCRGRMLSGSWLMIRSTSGTPTTPSPCSRQCICAMALTQRCRQPSILSLPLPPLLRGSMARTKPAASCGSSAVHKGKLLKFGAIESPRYSTRGKSGHRAPAGHALYSSIYFATNASNSSLDEQLVFS